MVDRQMADVLEPNKKKKKEPGSPCSVGWSDDARRNQRIPLVPFAMGSLEWPPSHAAGPCVPLARGTPSTVPVWDQRPIQSLRFFFSLRYEE